MNETLHDISNHIKNLQHEIPHHVPKDKKPLVKDIITSSFKVKEAKKFCRSLKECIPNNKLVLIKFEKKFFKKHPNNSL